MAHPVQDELIARLADPLGRAEAAALVHEVVRATGDRDVLAAVVELLDELHAASSKAGRSAVEALPEMQRRGGLAEIASWLDLGVALAGSSGATAMRYFRESPLLLRLIEPAAARGRVLELALELAETEPAAALELLRVAPELLAVLALDELPAWIELSIELARCDYVLGIELLKQAPAVARAIPVRMVRDWAAFGMKLITQNSLGKTDYLGTLEFFRTSPAILGDVEGLSVRAGLIDLGSVVAGRDPATAIALLAEAPALLRRIPAEDRRVRVLQYGALIAERDAETALAYLRRSPEMLALIGETAAAREAFEDWFRAGMEVLGYSVEGARAYFALETQQALASVERAMSGIPLRRMARQLKLFAQALCGADVTIQALPDSLGEAGKEPVRAKVSPDGRTISLPSLLRRYPTGEENVRLYTIMTAHEAGHLEFGTYRVRFDQLADRIAAVRARYRRADEVDVGTLRELFELYPQPGLIRDLWTLLEDARVEYHLQREYPGLGRDLAALARDAATTRSLLHGLSVREMVVDCLLLLSTQEPRTVRIPEAIAPIVERAWALCRTILAPSATAEDAIRLADRVYVALEEMVATTASPAWPGDRSEPEADQGAGPTASEDLGGQYRPVTNFAYRGTMDPELVRERDEAEAEGGNRGGVAGSGLDGGALPVDVAAPSGGASQGGDAPSIGADRPGEPADDALQPGGTLAASVEEMVAIPDDRRGRQGHGRETERGFLYDEWDGAIQDYRMGWCRVIERPAPEGTADFAEATLGAHGASVRLLRRYFESLRPPGLRRVQGQPEGEDLDLDAAVRRVADRAAGAELSDRIYVRREKRERDVAALFLVDLSGSTSRRLEGSGRRVIDVEREGLVLLGEALGAIGDQYAMYGYSGRGRGAVDFVVLKDFDEPGGGRVARRLGTVTPLQQNRDGAAIRHAAAKLLGRTARVKLLVLISDGKPLDDGYADEYSLEDTKMALREARMRGIDPFCITVDREAGAYLRRMYGDVRFLIIDRAEALPERLPRLYRRLTA